MCDMMWCVINHMKKLHIYHVQHQVIHQLLPPIFIPTDFVELLQLPNLYVLILVRAPEAKQASEYILIIHIKIIFPHPLGRGGAEAAAQSYNSNVHNHEI